MAAGRTPRITVFLRTSSKCRELEMSGDRATPVAAEACHGRLVVLAEAQFGENSSHLVREPTAEAQALRKLGRSDEADKLERRAQSIQSGQSKPCCTFFGLSMERLPGCR